MLFRYFAIQVVKAANIKMSLSTFAEIASAPEVQADELLYDGSLKGRNASIAHINALLDNCNSIQIRIIGDTIKATKESLKKNIT